MAALETTQLLTELEPVVSQEIERHLTMARDFGLAFGGTLDAFDAADFLLGLRMLVAGLGGARALRRARANHLLFLMSTVIESLEREQLRRVPNFQPGPRHRASAVRGAELRRGPPERASARRLVRALPEPRVRCLPPARARRFFATIAPPLYRLPYSWTSRNCSPSPTTLHCMRDTQ